MKQLILMAAMTLAFAANAMAQDADSLYAKEMLKAGTAAPDFILRAPDGSRHSLSQLKGSYVLLDFWASWCPDCRKDMPRVKALHEKYGGKVKFVGISFDDKKENWEKYLRDNGLSWLQLSELKRMREAVISKTYKVKWIPSMYLIDPDGNIVLSTVMIEKVEQKLSEL